jgi:beta-lactamase class A
MRRTGLLLVALVTFGCTQPHGVPLPQPVPVPDPALLPSQAFDSRLDPLEHAIRARLEAEPGEYGIAVVDLETGRTLGVNDVLEVHAASTMKVPILLELYRRAAASEIRLDDTVPVRNTFRSIADSSEYSLTVADDSEHGLYEMIGGQASYRDLARRMTVRSSNLATNILIDVLGADRVRFTTRRAGGEGMHVLRGVEDGPAFRAGMNNVTTARGFANVLAAIARCDILPRTYCDEILDILAAQEFREMIPAGLPAGVRVAHKTGWITGIQHDGGIIMPANSPPFVLVVLSRGGADTTAVRRVAADIARLAWSALGPDGSLRPRWPPATAELLALHERVRLPAFPAPDLNHDELWTALQPVVDGTPALHVEEVARSLEGRAIRLVRFGSGPRSVLAWSQMHGDETTASRALADVLHYIATEPDAPRVRRWSERITLLAVPMLNPDGADVHRRQGTHGIDINRDARALATPEGRALKNLQERFRPEFGFNLHDQNPRSRVAGSDRIAAMALLAPPPDADATETPSFSRARRLTAHIARAVAPMLGRHLTRYDDSYNVRAFGDGMQSWGVSTVLIESGSWRGDASKHYLRRANFVALVAALDAIADGSWEEEDATLYTSLPQNGRPVNDIVVRGGTVVLPGLAPYRADITIDGAAVGGPARTQIVDIGDLREAVARDTIDVSGLYIHPALDNARGLHPGAPVDLTVRLGPGPASAAIWHIVDMRARQLRAPGRQPD